MLLHTRHIPAGCIPATVPNVVMDGGDFYISFNDSDENFYGHPTTALVWGQMQRFFILNGDHRDAYAALLPQGWDACFDYFRSNVAQANRYSDRLPPEGEALPQPPVRRTLSASVRAG